MKYKLSPAARRAAREHMRRYRSDPENRERDNANARRREHASLEYRVTQVLKKAKKKLRRSAAARDLKSARHRVAARERERPPVDPKTHSAYTPAAKHYQKRWKRLFRTDPKFRAAVLRRRAKRQRQEALLGVTPRVNKYDDRCKRVGG